MSLRFAILPALALVLAACSSSDSGDAGPEGGFGCRHASDCTAGTVCIAHACVATTPCSTSRMCPSLVCDATRGVCVECLGDSDCGGGARCSAGVCIATVSCTGDRDCTGMAEVCDTAAGRCVECNLDADCAPDQMCAATHACVARPVPDGGSDLGDDAGNDAGTDGGADGGVDLGTDAGPHCASDAECSDGTFCNGAERCLPGAPGATPLGCVAGAMPCAAGRCTEASMSCTSCDNDFDSARAVGCGGTDCNDDDASVHPGATELCDGVDSDCSTGGGLAVDEDADGDMFSPSSATCTGGPYPKTDCDDHTPTAHPGGIETCNGVDDDCDGNTDEPPAWGDCSVGESCLGGSCTTTPTGRVVQVAVGGAFSCARREVGDVYCWGGQASYGNLGDGGPDSRSVAGPPVLGISDAMSIGIGSNHGCVVRSGGTVACWGYDSWGMVGDGATSFAVPAPRMVLGLAGTVLQVGAAAISTCALLSTGEVQCWGGNREGQLGNGSTTDSLGPVYASGLTRIGALSPGGETYCVRDVDNFVQCWGDRSYGSIGDGTTSFTPQTTPIAATPAINVHELCSGYGHNCGRTGGTVSCWGALVDGTRAGAPTAIAGITDAVQITCGDASDCVLHSGGTVSCWGANDRGQLGIGTTSATRTSSPTATVTGLTDASQISTSGEHTCALRLTGDVVCWGWNMFGQLGDGSTVDRTTPVTVMGIPR